MANSLYHVRICRKYVSDYYRDQESCVFEGWTHAGSVKQAAYNIARKHGVSTQLKCFGDTEERFCYEEIPADVGEEDKNKDKGLTGVTVVSIFDDMDL